MIADVGNILKRFSLLVTRGNLKIYIILCYKSMNNNYSTIISNSTWVFGLKAKKFTRL